MEGETAFVVLFHVTKYDWFMFHIFLDFLFFKKKKKKNFKKIKLKAKPSKNLFMTYEQK